MSQDSSEQNRSTHPELSLPLRTDYPNPRHAFEAAVWHASGRGDLSKLKQLCCADGVEHALLTEGNTTEFVKESRQHAFDAAVTHEQYNVLEYLYTEGCKPSTWNLRKATGNRHARMVKNLLDHGVDANSSGVLSLAVDDESILDMILAQGVHPDTGIRNRRDSSKTPKEGNGAFLSRDKYSPLMYAVKGSTLAVIKKLLDHGANPALQNPLHVAALVQAGERDPADNRTVMQLLIDRGCDVNQHDDCLWKASMGRPLHWALEVHGTVENVKFLLDRGADPRGRNFYGDCPIDWAAKAGTDSPEIRRLLAGTEAEEDLGWADGFTYAENWYEPKSWRKTKEVKKLWKK